MNHSFDVEDLILNYDPEAPAERFVKGGLEAALLARASRLPHPVSWPAGARPAAQPLDPAPHENDDLTRFAGYDALVVTWTAAEAAALAALFTPDHLPSAWYLYRHGVDAYIPLVTGPRAPFNDTKPDMARYYHTLGLYFPCVIGNARVLLFKSGLHFAYDGPHTPLQRLVAELVQTIRPRLLITTGTGGGIGTQAKLGDVVIASKVKFDCTTQFKEAAFAKSEYSPSELPAGAIDAIAPDLTKVNAAYIQGARPVPTIFTKPADALVTTDFFGFDDSTDHYRLQNLGRACDMGDAMIGLTMKDFPLTRWYSVRNVSDPQIPNPDNDIEKAKREAGQIYTRYGPYTTAASVIATWAIITSARA
ncbi:MULTISPECIES: phosphorylase family protein [Burkholderia]|uniref:Nucleoside phosphorylase domain-containing protein n=1 Tax=Burkholderia savannae TaxID=1637837 RepID=A0ABR5T413_9BURK|nr:MULTISPECIES: hypothetical protein [Burkholderia]AOJ84110.1 hypothetical protein WS86_26395 [Burkholderia savannae]AOK49669.1 hypothetical protein WT60_22465 [Burkholderia sp. MSMB617WGS]KVK82318.1 hypothetical protein WS91_10180 [Burkholderia sp. MSMB1498]KWZ37945.1 hypothetical protein WS72_23805 [Burkholderia savannae]